MDKETLKQLLIYVEQSQDVIMLLLEDETLPEIERANLSGRYDGLAIIHAHMVKNFIK